MFAGKTWWVTGATSGIGAALAEALVQAGADVILSGRNVAILTAMAERYGPGALSLPFEATDFERIPSLAEQAWKWAESRKGRIDGLINNAGVSQRSLAVDTVFEVYRRIIDIDLLGPIALTQALLPRMASAGGGHIVAISSIAGIVGAPVRSAYSAAKHGVIGYHDSVRAETAHLGMHVLVVAPGSVRTNVSKNALDSKGNVRGFSDDAIDNGMDPQTAAARILEAIVAGKRELILAEGMEAEIARLRRADPNALFDLTERLVADGYATRLTARKS
jgi:dehydrogenase/reductase SDR family member 7B